MKKLAKLLDRLDNNGGEFPPFTEGIASLFEKIIYFRVNIEKASKNPTYEVGLSTLWDEINSHLFCLSRKYA